MACGEGDLLPYHHLSHSSRVSVLSTPAVDTAVAMFITMICAPLTLGQPPNFDPESMHSFYDDDDDVVSGVYHCN